jgi:hypothetical protein
MRIQFILAVVLPAALAVRVGEAFTHGNNQDTQTINKPALHYPDVKFVIDGGDSIAHIKGEWTMRNSKTASMF